MTASTLFRIGVSTLLLVVVGRSSAAVPEPPPVFDVGSCSAVHALLARGGTDLQRSEVAGTYLLDAPDFRERYVRSRMEGYVAPGSTARDVPSEITIQLADPEKVPRLEALRREAEQDFLKESPQAYERVGPLLVLEADGSWTSRRRDDGTVAGGGRYVTRGRLVVLLDDLDAEAAVRGPSYVALTFDGTGLASDPIASYTLDRPDRGIRSYRRTGRQREAHSPAADLPRPPEVRRANVLGVWRVRAESIRPFLSRMREAAENLRSTQTSPEDEHPFLGGLVQMFAGMDPFETLTYRFDEDGTYVAAVLVHDSWQMRECGRWLLSGDTVVVWGGPPRGPTLGPRVAVQVFALRAGALLQRQSGGEGWRFERPAR